MLKAMHLLILASALLPAIARASEMFFSTDDVGQTWLQIVGRIDDGDDAKFKNMLVGAINRREQIERVSIYSPGGRVGPAMRIGRYIRTLHLSTVAPQLVPLLGRQTCDVHTMSGRTTVLEYEPLRNRGDPRCMCAGECFLIWAAGSVRYGDGVQIRRITARAEDEGKRADPPATHLPSSHKIIEEYLGDIGVPEATISRIFNAADRFPLRSPAPPHSGNEVSDVHKTRNTHGRPPPTWRAGQPYAFQRPSARPPPCRHP
jgi:hypothetical protein